MSDIGKINVGANVKAQFESDLALEIHAVKQLNEAIHTAAEVGDHASRALFENGSLGLRTNGRTSTCGCFFAAGGKRS